MKEEKKKDSLKIIDESGDRKYFVIIPNCVVNGSGVYERAMYLEMKRFAGEKGVCFASIRTMAKRLKASVNTVQRTIKQLIKRGWIKKSGVLQTGGKPVNCYTIVDIWSVDDGDCDDGEEEKRKGGVSK